MYAREIISSHPDVRGAISEGLVRLTEETLACTQACTTCADACLAEDTVKDLRQCIRLNLDCATICMATAELASRRTGSDEAILRQAILLCQEICRTCGEECERHADVHEHCRICAEACRHCEESCRMAAADVH